MIVPFIEKAETIAVLEIEKKKKMSKREQGLIIELGNQNINKLIRKSEDV